METCMKYQPDVNKYTNRYVKEPMVLTDTGTSAFDRIYLDLVGPLYKDSCNYSYSLTLQCDLNKFIEAYPLNNKDTISVAKCFLNNFILRYGILSKIISDRGTEFVSNVMKEVCQILDIKQLTSTAYHHQSIGSLENTHKNGEPQNWSAWLPYWCFAFNTTVHTETQYTPYELVFGKQCRIPSNLTCDIGPLYNHYDYP